MANPSRPTYRTIAQEAGVSAVTVSLALRNNPRISEATRARIHKIAKAQGYQKDPNIAKLMHHLRMRRRKNLSSNLVALRILTEENQRYVARVLNGAQERADTLGYALEVIDLDTPPLSPARLERVLRSRGVEGLILLPISPLDLKDRLNWSDFSIVSTSHSVLSPSFNTVVPNHFSNMMRLCEMLNAKGENRIGILTQVKHDLRVDHRFTSAYLWHSLFGGGQPIPPLLVETESLNPEIVTQWIEEHAPHVIVTELGLMEGIRRFLPESTMKKIKWAYTGLEENTRDQWGICENPGEVGSAAVDLLAGMIQRVERGIPEYPRCMEIKGSVTLE